MPVPSEAIVRDVLGRNDRGLIVRDCISDAWASVSQKYPESANWRRGATKAGVVWEEIIQNAIARLTPSDLGVRPLPHFDTVSFTFDELVLLRFKKADFQLRTSNYPTPLALSFHDHEMDDLFGYQGAHRVEAVYVLNQFRTAVVWIGVVARQAANLLWKFELGRKAQVISFPTRTPESKPAHLSVIKRKPTDSDKSQGKSGDEGE